MREGNRVCGSANDQGVQEQEQEDEKRSSPAQSVCLTKIISSFPQSSPLERRIRGIMS